MTESTPLSTVAAFVDAMNRGDLEAAIAHYEPDAILVVEPGAPAVGTRAVREALAGLLAIRPKLTTHRHELLALGDLALYHSYWSLTGTAPDGAPVHQGGRSADVLRRGPDARWRIALDNPWGTVVLGEG
jgi:ketosteroid isomerase-like protein